MNRLLFIILLLTPHFLAAQSHDFLLLKKRDKTIATYYPGNNIAFTTTSGVYIEATITQIQNDTISLQQYNIQQVPTRIGVSIPDTLGSYRYAYDYKQIKAIGRTGRKFNLSASSASLLGGGILLTLASGVVYLADRSKFSPGLLIGSVALAGIGYIMGRTTGKGPRIILRGQPMRLILKRIKKTKELYCALSKR